MSRDQLIRLILLKGEMKYLVRGRMHISDMRPDNVNNIGRVGKSHALR